MPKNKMGMGIHCVHKFKSVINITPDVPNNLHTSNTNYINGTKNVVLMWDIAQNASAYEVQVSTVDSTFSSGVTVYDNIITNYVNISTICNRYYCRVRSINGSVYSEYGNTWSFIVNAGGPMD